MNFDDSAAVAAAAADASGESAVHPACVLASAAAAAAVAQATQAIDNPFPLFFSLSFMRVAWTLLERGERRERESLHSCP